MSRKSRDRADPDQLPSKVSGNPVIDMNEFRTCCFASNNLFSFIHRQAHESCGSSIIMALLYVYKRWGRILKQPDIRTTLVLWYNSFIGTVHYHWKLESCRSNQREINILVQIAFAGKVRNTRKNEPSQERMVLTWAMEMETIAGHRSLEDWENDTPNLLFNYPAHMYTGSLQDQG